MNIKHLKYFVAVCDKGGITAAAKALHVSASPLSRRIRELEEAVGCELFFRRAGAMELTEDGRELYSLATRMNRLYAEIIDLRNRRRDNENIIRIGLRSVHPRLRMAMLDAIRIASPDSVVDFRPQLPDVQIVALAERTIDFGTMRSDRVTYDLSSLMISREYLALALPDREPFHSISEVNLADVENLTLIMHYPPLHPVLADFVQAGGSTTNVDVNIMGAIPALISQGNYFALVSQDNESPGHRSADQPGVVIRPIAGRPTMNTYIVWRSDRENELIGFVNLFKAYFEKPLNI